MHVDQVLGGGGILAHHDGGNDIAVALVQSVHAGGLVGGIDGENSLLFLAQLSAGNRPRIDVSVFHAGGDAVHIVDDDVGAAGAGADLLDGGGQVDSGIVAVDTAVAACTTAGQRDVFLVDDSVASLIRVLGYLGAVVGAAGVVVGVVIEAGDLLHSVHTVVVHGVGVPAVDSGTAAQARTLGSVHLNGVHSAVQEDSVGVHILGSKVAVAVIHASDEDVVVGGLH